MWLLRGKRKEKRGWGWEFWCKKYDPRWQHWSSVEFNLLSQWQASANFIQCYRQHLATLTSCWTTLLEWRKPDNDGSTVGEPTPWPGCLDLHKSLVLYLNFKLFRTMKVGWSWVTSIPKVATLNKSPLYTFFFNWFDCFDFSISWHLR